MASSSTAYVEHPKLVLLRSRSDRASDRRAHHRHRADEVSGIDHVRLKYGPIVTLVDISAGGAQIETVNHQLQPGASLVMQIVGQDGPLAVAAQVLRCHISALGGHPTYSGAVEFKRRLEVEQLIRSAGLHDRLTAPQPHDVTQAAIEMDRAANLEDGDRGPWMLVSAPGLAAARAMIESVASRRGHDCARQMGMLLGAAAPMFERGMRGDLIVESVLDSVARLIPGATIRLLDAVQFALVTAEDAFYVDVPNGSGGPARKLLIEFVRKGRLEAGHLELLRLAAHFVSLADDVERVCAPLGEPSAPEPSVPAPAAAASAPSASPTALQAGWRKLIVRYRDGRLLKGYCRGFQPMTGHVHVSAAPDAPALSRVTVPLSHLKALFFVYDLEGGAAAPVESKARVDLLRGRQVTVTFLDGEALAGTTMTYSADGPGFFVLPLDESSNNEQIFVVTGAVRHMQFA